MNAKYQKEKQTDSPAPLSILTVSISLALSPNCGCSARPAIQARPNGMIMTSQNRNMRSMYVPIFLAQRNTNNITKRHGFYV